MKLSTEQLTHFSFEDIVKNAQDMIIVTEAQNVSGLYRQRLSMLTMQYAG